jgi:hypothetical protein
MNTLFAQPARLVSSSSLRYLLVGLVALIASGPARATTVIPPAFNSLVSQADYIVRAVVKSVTSELRTDGQRRHIVTKVGLEVREVIAGTAPEPLVLEMLGGKVGDDEMVVDGAPKFRVGDEDILFVHGNGRQFNPLVALMHGRYPILHDTATGRDYVARSNGVPLHSESEVNQPMAPAPQGTALASPAPALSPAEFISRIKNAISQNSRAKLEN